jgi:hypothetical protein
MAFTQDTFAPVGANSTDAPAIYSYSTSDTIATITAAGYFVDKQFQLEEGDIILCSTSNGFITISYDNVSESAKPSGLNAASVPSLEIYSDDGIETITATQNNYADILVSTITADSVANNFWTDNGDGTATYTGNPCLQRITSLSSLDLASGVDNVRQTFRKNGALIQATPAGDAFANAWATRAYSKSFYTLNGDTINLAAVNLDTNVNFRKVKLELHGDFKGWVSESDILGDELFVNPNIDDTTGFFGSTTTISASGGELLSVATATTSLTTATVSGLTIGERYRIHVSAKRGAQGTTQSIPSVSFGTIVAQDVTTTSFVDYYFDVVATFTAGTVNIGANTSGAIGDEIIINYLSVKEYL